MLPQKSKATTARTAVNARCVAVLAAGNRSFEVPRKVVKKRCRTMSFAEQLRTANHGYTGANMENQ